MTELTFEATVEPMFGNINLEDKTDDEILVLLEDTYNLPPDCVDSFDVQA